MPNGNKKNHLRNIGLVAVMIAVIIFIANFSAITGIRHKTPEDAIAAAQNTENLSVQTAVEKKPNFYERIGNFFKENPKHFGIFVIIAGLFIVAASFFNWDWIFKGRTYNLDKIEGTANFFGRGFARLKFGAIGIGLIIFGIVLLIIG